MRTVRLHHVVCLALLSAPAAAWASTVIGLSLDELTARADRVVRARVQSVESRKSPDGARVHTYTRLAVLADLKGGGSEAVTVRQLGGTVDGASSRISGDASFAAGEEVVVFLRQNPDDAGLYHLIGLSQGKFRVQVRDGVHIAERDLSGLSLLRPQAGGLAPAVGDSALPAQLSLESLLRTVRGAGE